jgi:hypothetical protein
MGDAQKGGGASEWRVKNMDKEKVQIRKPVMYTMVILYVLVIVVGLVSPEAFSDLVPGLPVSLLL